MPTALEGTVVRDGQPLGGAYVRLLGPSGDFVGERRTLEDGAFRFNVSPGAWTIRWLAPGGEAGERVVEVSEAQVSNVPIEVGRETREPQP